MPDLLTGGFGLYLEQQLTEYDPNLIITKFAPAWTVQGNRHQTRGDLPKGALKVSATRLTLAGNAGIYDGQTMDIPIVSYGAEQAEFGALRFVIGARWNEDELASYQMAQKTGLMLNENPIETKMRAMKEFIDLKAHNTILFGSRARNFRGWFNNGTVPITAVNPSIKPYIMTDKQIYDWISGILVEFAIKNALSPSQVIMYIDPRLARVFNQFLSNGTGSTIAAQLVSPNTQSGLVKQIETVYELTPEVIQAKTAGLANPVAVGTGRIVLGSYADDQSAVRRWFPFERTVPEKIPGTYDYCVLGSYGTTELMHRNPLQFQFIDYSTATV